MIHKETNVTGLFPKLIHRFLSSSPSRAIDLVASDAIFHTSSSHVKMLKDQKEAIYQVVKKWYHSVPKSLFLVMNLQSFCVI